MTINYATLRTELLTDPAGLGYAGKSDYACAGLLNTVRGSIAVARDTIPTWMVLDAVAQADLAALTANQLQTLHIVISAGEVSIASANIRAIMSALFPAGSVTRANLVAIVNRTGTRAEQLFGVGTAVTDGDVARAR